MEGIKILKRPKLKNPYLIVAWPGMGEVAFKAAIYLVEKLKAKEFACIASEEFFYITTSTIEEGILDLPQLPYNKFYYWKNPATKIGGSAKDFGGALGKNDLIIFISSAQPDLAKADSYCKRIIQFVKSFKVKMIIGFAAMPVAIDHTQEPKIWYASTSKGINNEFKKYNFNLLSEGQISGMNGLFLGMAKRCGFSGFCLLGEIPLYTIQIENPRASYVVLEALSRILNLRIDFAPLLEQSKFMESEINKLLDYLNLGPPTAGPISEDDIERIKKSLSQLSKLPVSVKEKIEKLFKEAKENIAKANELKVELDRWGAYKEYEDRFLDLFKKSKDIDG